MSCCQECPFDGIVGPKMMMLAAVKYADIPDQLSPEEINALADLAIEDLIGQGRDRRLLLGEWYPIVQAVINERYRKSRL